MLIICRWRCSRGRFPRILTANCEFNCIVSNRLFCRKKSFVFQEEIIKMANFDEDNVFELSQASVSEVWGNEQSIQLIDIYEEFELLWNPRHSLYYNKFKKHDAWKLIAARMGFDLSFLKHKMSSLLASFRREKSKGVKTIGTGKAKREVYTSKWFAFARMASFLMGRDDPRNRVNTMEEDAEITLEEEEDLQEIEVLVHPDFQCTTSSQPSSSGSLPVPKINETPVGPRKVIPTKRLRAKQPDEDAARLDEAFKILKDAAAPPKRDQMDLFGELVASKMKMYEPATQTELQQKNF